MLSINRFAGDVKGLGQLKNFVQVLGWFSNLLTDVVHQLRLEVVVARRIELAVKVSCDIHVRHLGVIEIVVVPQRLVKAFLKSNDSLNGSLSYTVVALSGFVRQQLFVTRLGGRSVGLVDDSPQLQRALLLPALLEVLVGLDSVLGFLTQETIDVVIQFWFVFIHLVELLASLLDVDLEHLASNHRVKVVLLLLRDRDLDGFSFHEYGVSQLTILLACTDRQELGELQEVVVSPPPEPRWLGRVTTRAVLEPSCLVSLIWLLLGKATLIAFGAMWALGFVIGRHYRQSVWNLL